MGSWFTNFQIRKSGEIGKEQVSNCLIASLAEQGYLPAEDMQEADAAVALVEQENSQWISLCSSLLAHDDPESCKALALPLSAQLHTDVLGIACFDSDYLYLNLINADEKLDAWVGIGAGKELGITRRNTLTAWKKKVADYPAFSAAAKGSYVCADEFLMALEQASGLPPEQGSASQNQVQDATFLYFRRTQGAQRRGAQLQTCYLHYAQPCFHGRENSVSFINMGDEFCGLSVYFLGPYVEDEEITFTDVKIQRIGRPPIDLELKKTQLPDGQWAYGWHNPEILLPPGIPRRMKPEKRVQLERERMRKLSFVPHGDPRRMLDITVVIVPDGNPENRAEWNVWRQYGSKAEFIKHHNSIWKRVRAVEEDPDQCLPLLNIEEFTE